MTTEAVALTDFDHDHIRAREGRPIAGGLDDALALEMEKRGLIRIVAPALRGRRLLGVAPGKVQAAGMGRPSSASPAAHPSRTKTPSGSAPGATQRPKTGKS